MYYEIQEETKTIVNGNPNPIKNQLHSYIVQE